MARKFLYFVAAMVILVIAGAFVFRVYGDELMEVAFVPDTEFTAQDILETNVYADRGMWLVPDWSRATLPCGFRTTWLNRTRPCRTAKKRPFSSFIRPPF